MLEVLGGDPRKLHYQSLRPMVLPWLTASGAALVLLALATRINIPSPFTGFVLRQMDAQASLDGFLLAWITGAALSALVITLATRPPKLGRANRLKSHKNSRIAVPAALVGVAVAWGTSTMALHETQTALYRENGDAPMLWIWSGVLTVIAFLPAMAQAGVQLVSRLLVAVGRRWSQAALIVSGRGLAASQTARSIVGAGSTLILVTTLVSLWALLGSIPATQAQRTIDKIDGSFVRVQLPNGVEQPEAKKLIQELLPLQTLLIRNTVVSRGGEDPAFLETIVATPDNLAHWQLKEQATMTAGEVPNVLATVFDNETAKIEVLTRLPVLPTDLPAGTDIDVKDFLIVFDPQGGKVDKGAVTRLVAENASPFWNVCIGGEEWIVGANDAAFEFRWLYVFTTIAATVLLAAVLVSASDDQREQLESLKPVAETFATGKTVISVLVIRAVTLCALLLAIGGTSGWLYARIVDDGLSTIGGVGTVIGFLCAVIVVVFAGFTASNVFQAHQAQSANQRASS